MSDIDLRDWFAGLAMQGMISSSNGYDYTTINHYAYQLADKMMEARQQEKTNG